MRIIITGGFGFVGSVLTRHFLSKGYEVLVLEHPSARKPEYFPDCEVVYGDITEESSLEKLKVGPHDALLHLAAQSSGPRSFLIPVTDVKINVLGTLNVINWCLANQIERILFASSFVVYGDQPQVEALNEELHCKPKSVYATSKLAGEHLLMTYAEPKGLKWNTLRMFNVYGPGQDISKPDQGVVGIFMNMLMRQDSIQVKGSLDRFRDLVHIDDVVNAWDLCLLQKDYHNRVYNLGSGHKTTFRALIESLIETMDLPRDTPVEQLPGIAGDIVGCYADLSRTHTELAYSPQVSLSAGLRSMWNWVKQNQQA